jgi:hypothetical protein
MPSLAYPIALPGPWQGVIQADDRRLKSPGNAPLALRALQREVVSVQRLEWVFTAAQAATFNTWWQTDLVFGGAWFVAEWMHPLGLDALVERRFIGKLVWTHIPGGSWKVNSDCEVRENPLGERPTLIAPPSTQAFSASFGTAFGS